MKLKAKAGPVRHELDTMNGARVLTAKAKKFGDTHYTGIIQVLAEVLDAAGEGDGTWVSIGRNQAGDSYLLTVQARGAKLYAGGASLEDLSDDCLNLLDTP